MAMSVVVLCPNGRRVNVKVTPNASILQIIEDACKKEKFDPDEYDLKHLHRILDPSNTVRYSNLPNKCQLELVRCAVPRKASNVTVHIATDSGLRLIHDFPPDTTLWEMLSHHEEQGNKGTLIPPDDGSDEPLIVYTMRRINGSQLKTTTLKSLGLTGGKCMFRHSLQKKSTSGQAHVSAPLSRPKVAREDNSFQVQQAAHNNELVQDVLRHHVQADLPGPSQPHAVLLQRQQQQQHQQQQQQQQQQQNRINPLPEPPSDMQQNHHGPPADIAVAEHPDVITSSRDCVPDVVQPQNGVLQPDIVADKGVHTHFPMGMDILEGHDGPSSSEYVPEPEQEEESMQLEENVIKLGSHDAILFSMDDAPRVDFSIEEENFFQLTVDEVKSLYREQQRIMNSLGEAPLMTKQMREMEESAKVLSALNQFPITQLRIYFPDNNVIQASFKSIETVAIVMEFLKTFLVNPSEEFSLVTRHPMQTLSPEMNLIAANCVPNARLYFSSSSRSPYLNDETLAKRSSFNSACGTLRSRKTRRPMSTAASYEDNAAGCSGHVSTASASVVTSEASIQKRTSANMHATGAIKKVPKWFKTGK